MSENERLGKATTQYQDWEGTVAIDNPDDLDRVYGLAGLDIKEWRIVGIDYYGGYEASFASALAVPAAEIKDFEDWRRIAEANGGDIPVTAFDLTREAAGQLLQAFKRISIHATPRANIYEPGFDLEITERRTPDQNASPRPDWSD